MIEDINNRLLKLEPEWGERKIENIKLLYELGNERKRSRIEKITAMSCRKLLRDSLLENQVLLPPSGEEVCGKGEILLGDVCFGKNSDGTDRRLYPLKVSLDDLRHGTICSGLTGTGKTTLAYHVAVQLAQKGVSVWIIDWNRSWSSLCTLPEDKYPFVKDIRVYTIGRDTSPFKFNIFFSPPPKVSGQAWLEIISERPLAKSLLSGQGSGSLILNEAEALLEEYKQGKLKQLPNIEDIKKRIEAKFLRGRPGLWRDSSLRVLSSLCRANNKELFGSRDPFDLATMLERPGITILELDAELPNSQRILFQETLLLFMYLFFLGKKETNKLRLLCICEEGQNLFPASVHEKQIAGETIQNIYREGRKLGMSTFTLIQEPHMVPNYAFQCKTQIHFANTTYKDVSTITNALFTKPQEKRYIDYIWVGQALAKIKGRVKNCLIRTPAPLPARRLTDEQLKELSRKWQMQN